MTFHEAILIRRNARLRAAGNIVLLACGCLLAGCHERPRTVAVIPRTTANSLWEPLHQGVVEEARKNGIHVYWNAPPDEDDTAGQMRLYGSLQKRGYWGFIFSPDETLSARSQVLATVESGTPVVIVDDELGPPPSARLSYVASDEEIGTRMAADRLALLLHGHGTVAITGIIPKSQHSVLREELFEKALASAAPQIQITSRSFSDTAVAHQQQVAQDLMAQPKSIDAIVSLSATATRGAYLAKLIHAPHSKMVIIGFDQDDLLPLQSDGVDAIIAQNTLAIGHSAMQNLIAESYGKPVPGITRVPPLLLTRDNIASPAVQNLLAYPLYPWRDQ